MNFLIAAPGGDDIMLGYQTLAYHDVLGLRQLLGLRTAPEFENWLERMGMVNAQGRLPPLSAHDPSMRRLFSAP